MDYFFGPASGIRDGADDFLICEDTYLNALNPNHALENLLQI